MAFRRVSMTLAGLVIVAGFLLAANPVQDWTLSEAAANYSFNAVEIAVNAGGNGVAQLLQAPAVPPPLWCNNGAVCNSSWVRRIPINVTIGGALINKQYFIQVNMTAADANFWALESGSPSNGGAVRFTAADGNTNLPFWIAPVSYNPPGWSTGGQTATYWVQLPTVPAGTSNRYIFLYHGNPGALTASAADPWQFFGVSQAYVGSMYYIQHGIGASQQNTTVATASTGCTGDDTSCTYALPAGFNFPYYSGAAYTVVRSNSFNTCINGFLNPISVLGCPFTDSMAALATTARIAPWWDDLYISQADEAIFGFQNLNSCPAPYNHNMGCISLRWVTDDFPIGGAERRNVTLTTFRNGVIQFDYGSFTTPATIASTGISSGGGGLTVPVVNPIRTLYCGGTPPTGACTNTNTTYNNANSLVYFARPFRNPEPTITKSAVETYSAGGGGYFTSNPTIDNTPAGGVHPGFTALYGFDAVIGAGCTVPACEVRFQISPTGATWYWYNGGTNRWVSTVAG
ncbi:MAG: DUF2341 domain-containing protein, partial [bacterium]